MANRDISADFNAGGTVVAMLKGARGIFQMESLCLYPIEH